MAGSEPRRRGICVSWGVSVSAATQLGSKSSQRELQQRKHRLLGVVLSLQGWGKGADEIQGDRAHVCPIECLAAAVARSAAMPETGSPLRGCPVPFAFHPLTCDPADDNSLLDTMSRAWLGALLRFSLPVCSLPHSFLRLSAPSH